MVEADSPEAQGGLLFASRLGDDDDGLFGIEDCAGPGGVLSAQPDVDAAGEVTLGVFCGVADIEKLGAGVAHGKNLFEVEGMQDLLQGFVEGGALACVEDGVVGEVGGGVGLIDGYEPDEMVFRSWAEERS